MTRVFLDGIEGAIDNGQIRIGGLVGRLVGDLTDGAIYLGGLVGTISGGAVRYGSMVGAVVDGVLYLDGLHPAGATPVPPPSGDPYFANVKALLHFDGTDGATTFTDVKGHMVTRLGNAVLQTAGALYGTASLTCPDIASGARIDHADMALGAGAWTIEGSIKLAAIPSNDDDGYGTICAVAASDADNAGVLLYAIPNSDEDPDFGALSMELPGSSSIDTADNVIERAVRTHIAITKNASNVITLWVNGVSMGTITNANAPTTVGPKFNQGAFGDFVGCIGLWDEWRLTPGVCRYTAPFTPDPPYPDSL